MRQDKIIAQLPDTSSWYQDFYTVYHKDIDFNGELRLSALLLMLQETAWNHARVIGIDYQREAFKSIIWVLSRMRIEMLDTAPLWMETVRLATSPTGIDRLFALRDFLATHADGRPFARISSAWVMIDAGSRRPVRPQNLLDEKNFHFEPPVMPGGTNRLKMAEPIEWGPDFRPGYADIDAHQHVNNVSYAQWCLDNLEPNWFKSQQLLSFDINFLAEVAWGQNISVGQAPVQLPDPAEALEMNPAPALIQDFGIRKSEGNDGAALVRLGWLAR